MEMRRRRTVLLAEVATSKQVILADRCALRALGFAWEPQDGRFRSASNLTEETEAGFDQANVGRMLAACH